MTGTLFPGKRKINPLKCLFIGIMRHAFRNLKEEDMFWFMSEETDIFSYLFICEQLDLDPEIGRSHAWRLYGNHNEREVK